MSSLLHHQVQIAGRNEQIAALKASRKAHNASDRKVINAQIKVLEKLVAKYEAHLASSEE